MINFQQTFFFLISLFIINSYDNFHTILAASWFDIQAEQGAKEDEKLEEENVPCIPAGENSELAACYLCHDQFEQFYNEKDEEWQLKNCIEKDKRLYHPMCHDDMIVS